MVLHNTHVKTLQIVLNAVASIVLQVHHHHGNILVWSHFQFKINIFTFKAITFQQPPILWNLLKVRDVPHGLHSARAITLSRPYTSGFGYRAYANSWNYGTYFP